MTDTITDTYTMQTFTKTLTTRIVWWIGTNLDEVESTFPETYSFEVRPDKTIDVRDENNLTCRLVYANEYVVLMRDPANPDSFSHHLFVDKGYLQGFLLRNKFNRQDVEGLR